MFEDNCSICFALVLYPVADFWNLTWFWLNQHCYWQSKVSLLLVFSPFVRLWTCLFVGSELVLEFITRCQNQIVSLLIHVELQTKTQKSYQCSIGVSSTYTSSSLIMKFLDINIRKIFLKVQKCCLIDANGLLV
jgi:hypothetical protein